MHAGRHGGMNRRIGGNVCVCVTCMWEFPKVGDPDIVP